MNLADIFNKARSVFQPTPQPVQPVAQPIPQPQQAPKPMDIAIGAATQKYPSVFNYISNKAQEFALNWQQKPANSLWNNTVSPYVNPLINNISSGLQSQGKLAAYQNPLLEVFDPQLKQEVLGSQPQDYNPLPDMYNKLRGDMTQYSLLNPGNLVKGGAFGSLFSGANKLINGQMPTLDDLSQGAQQGIGNSWVYNITNPATNKLLEVGASKLPILQGLTDEGLALSQQGLNQAAKQGAKEVVKQLPKYIAQTTAREVAETPLETSLFAKEDSDKTGKSYGQSVKDRALADLFSNTAFGLGKSAVGASIPLVKGTKVSVDNLNQKIADETGIPLQTVLQQGRLGEAKPTFEQFVKSREPQFEQFLQGYADSKGVKVNQLDPEEMQKVYDTNWMQTLKQEYEGQPYKQGQEKKPEFTFDQHKQMAIDTLINNKDFPLDQKRKDYIINKLNGAKDETELETVFTSLKESINKVIEDKKSKSPTMAEIFAQRQKGATITQPEVKPEEVPFPTQENPNAQPVKKADWVSDLLDQTRKQRESVASIEQSLVKADKGNEKQINKQLKYYEKKLGIDRLNEAKAIFDKSGNTNDFFSYLKQIDNKPAFPDSPDVKTTPLKTVEELVNQKPNLEVKPEEDTRPFAQKALEVKSKQDYETVKKDIDIQLNDLDTLIKANGKTWEQVVDEVETGKDTQETKLIKNWFDTFKKNAEQDGVKVGTLEDYFTHISKAKAQEIIQNGSKPDTFGSVFQQVFFGKKRKDTLVDYLKSKEAMKAYALESYKNRFLTDDQKAELKVANEIKEDVISKAKHTLKSLFGKTQTDFVTKIEGLQSKDAELKTYDESKVGNSLVRSVSDRAAMLGTQDKKSGASDFWTDFIYPFRKAQMDLNSEIEKIMKLYGKDGKIPGFSEDEVAEMILKKRSELMAQATDTFTQNVKNAKFSQVSTKQLVNDIFDEFVAKDIKEPVLAEEVLAFIRANTGRGALGFNIASAIQNLFETKRAFALGSTKSVTRTLRKVSQGEDYVSKYVERSEQGTALERKYIDSPISKAIAKVDKGLFFLFDKSERFKDNLMLGIFEEQGKEKGLKGENLAKFVLQKYDQFAIKYGKGNDIGLFKSPINKTIFQFNQYAVKDLMILLDKTKGAISGDTGDAKYVAKYTMWSIAQMLTLKALLGTIGFGGKTGTPADLITSIFVDKEVPVAPIVQAPVNLAAYLSAKENTDDENKDYNLYNAKRNMIRSLYTVGVPGSNQLIFKSGLQALLGSEFVDEKIPYGYGEDAKRGYMQTYDKRVANELSDKPLDQVKGVVFGSSYDPKRQEYIRAYKAKESPALSQTESEVYKSLPKDQRTAFIEQSQQTGKQDKAWKQFQASSVKGATNALAISIPPKDATTSQVKEFNSRVKMKLDNSIEPSSDELKAYFFRDVDNLPETTEAEKVNKQIERYKKLKSIADSDVDQSIKDKVIELSGLPKEDVTYYKQAKEETLVRTIKYAEQKGTMKRSDWLLELAKGRKVVGDAQQASTEVINALYERGDLEDDERDFLNNIKFDVITGKYYMDRDYKGTSSGQTSAKKLSSLFNFDAKLDTMSKGLDSLVKQPTIQANKTLLKDILTYKPSKKTLAKGGYQTSIRSRFKRS